MSVKPFTPVTAAHPVHAASAPAHILDNPKPGAVQCYLAKGGTLSDMTAEFVKRIHQVPSPAQLGAMITRMYEGIRSAQKALQQNAPKHPSPASLNYIAVPPKDHSVVQAETALNKHHANEAWVDTSPLRPGYDVIGHMADQRDVNAMNVAPAEQHPKTPPELNKYDAAFSKFLGTNFDALNLEE